MSALDASPQGAESHEDGIGGDGEVAEDPAPVAIPLALSCNPLNVLHGERVSNPIPDSLESGLYPDPSCQHIQRITSIVPQELAEMIIDYLYYDKRALGRCGLVCRFWLPSSRFHLFSTILLHERNIYTALTALCSPDSTIPPYVRRVDISGGGDSGKWMNKWLQRLPLLSSVDSLLLFGIHWDPQMLGAMEKMFPFFRNLKTLQLNSVTFETLHNAIGFLSSASSLEYLRLGYLNASGYYEEIDAASVTQFPVPSLREIVFEERFCWPELLDWLSLGQTVASVNTVTCYIKFIQVIHPMSTFFKALGPALEHLTFDFMSCKQEYHDDYCEGGMDIRHNRSLRTILFEGIGGFFDWTITLLSQVTSRSIESVTLDVLPYAAQNLPALVALFTGRNAVFVGRSTRLRFKISGDINNEYQTVIREHLYELDAQGRLEFI